MNDALLAMSKRAMSALILAIPHPLDVLIGVGFLSRNADLGRIFLPFRALQLH